MYKSKATIVAIILAALAVFVVVTVTSVLNHGNEDRYQGVPSPDMPEMTDESAMAPTEAVDSSETMTQNEADVMNEAATEALPAASSEAVVEAMENVPTTAEQIEAAVTEQVAASEQPVAGSGQIHIVTAEGLKYNPLVVLIQPGDTVAWENMPTHDTQSLEGLIPEGAEAWHSELGKNYERTFTQQGIYVYKCTPHFGAGMGGAIIVGKPVNLDAIKAADAKGAAGRLVRKAIAEAEKL